MRGVAALWWSLTPERAGLMGSSCLPHLNREHGVWVSVLRWAGQAGDFDDLGAPMQYSEADRLAFLRRQEPEASPEQLRTLRASLWTDARIDMAIALGG